MADNQRTIDILIQLKQAGGEIVEKIRQEFADIVPQVESMQKAIDSAGDAARPALQGISDEAAKAGKSIKDSMEEGSAAGTNSFKNMLKDIKGEAGKGSVLGQTLKLLSGGGAIAALSYGASQFANFATKIAEAADAARKGDADFSDSLGTLLREVPVLGGITRGFDALREAITGEGLELEKSTEFVKQVDAALKQHQKLLEDGKAATLEWAKAMSMLRDEFTRLTTPEALKGVVNAQIAAADRLAEARKKYEEEAKLVDPKTGEAGELVKAEKDFQAAKSKSLALQQGFNEALRQQQEIADYAKKGLAKNEPGDRYFPNTGGTYSTSAQEAVDAARAALDEQNQKTIALRNTLLELNQNAAAAASRYEQERQQIITNANAQLSVEQGKVDEAATRSTAKVQEEMLKAQGELKKPITEALTAWHKFFGDVATGWAETMKKLGDKVRDAVATPQEKFSKQSDYLQSLRANGAIDDPTLKRAMDENQAAFDKAESEKVLAADRTHALISQGVQKLKAESLLAYDQDVSSYKVALDNNEITAADFQKAMQARQQQYQDDLTFIDAHAADEKLLIQDRIDAALKTGLSKEVAEAKLKYDEDVANWREAVHAKTMTPEEFNAKQVEGENDRLRGVREASAQYDHAKEPKAPDASFTDGASEGIQEFTKNALDASRAGKQLTLDIGSGLVDAFTAVVTGSESAAQAFSQFALSIISDIAKMIIEAEIGAVLSKFFPGFGGAAGHNQGGLIEKKNLGGLVQGFLGGGLVPGTGPNVDTVPAMLTKGEYVVQRPVVEQPGMLGILHSINSGSRHFSAGGMAGVSAPLAGVKGPGGSYDGIKVLPTLIANESAMRTILAGGSNALIDFLRQNKNRVNGALNA